MRSLNHSMETFHLEQNAHRQMEQPAAGFQMILEGLRQGDVAGSAQPVQLFQLLGEASPVTGFLVV